VQVGYLKEKTVRSTGTFVECAYGMSKRSGGKAGRHLDCAHELRCRTSFYRLNEFMEGAASTSLRRIMCRLLSWRLDGPPALGLLSTLLVGYFEGSIASGDRLAGADSLALRRFLLLTGRANPGPFDDLRGPGA